MSKLTPKASGQTPKKGIYLLPNLLTTGTLFAGCYAITAAMSGRFEVAAISIFVAMLMDGLDGRVARMTNTQTTFGAEYDSLSDMVAFGVAPALVLHAWSLHTVEKIGWTVTFAFVACVALRLARFNTQVGQADKRYFQGLPSPTGAAILASMVWTGASYEISGQTVNWFVGIVCLISAALMVSNVRYHSFKELDIKGKKPFFWGLLIVLLFIFISIDPPIVLFCLSFLFALSGPVVTIWRLREFKKTRKNQSKDTR